MAALLCAAWTLMLGLAGEEMPLQRFVHYVVEESERRRGWWMAARARTLRRRGGCGERNLCARSPAGRVIRRLRHVSPRNGCVRTGQCSGRRREIAASCAKAELE